MKTMYVYLSENTYTTEHNTHMVGLMWALHRAGDLEMIEHKDREEMGAVEYKVKASNWVANFLKYMELCDMLMVTTEPIDTEA